MRAWVWLVVAGCGLTSERYQREYLEVYCQENNRCLELAQLDPEVCDPDLAPDDGEVVECEYDVKKARQCLAELESASCSEDNTLLVPTVCAEVCTALE